MLDMFASTKRPTIPPSVIEIESLPESPTSSTRKAPDKPETIMRSIKNAFGDAWKDISSMQRFKSPQSRRVVVKLLLVAWNVSLLLSIGKLSSMLVLGTELDSPCHPDGDFYLNANDTLSNEFRHSNNWGNAKGFFQITLSWGNFDFTTAKLIDVAWDLVCSLDCDIMMHLLMKPD
ncbi:hypothetical protein NW752_000154 [Fusarium irregulare]|nr:hypothetical protein NW752_000154 [Fusarium irregulare]